MAEGSTTKASTPQVVHERPGKLETEAAKHIEPDGRDDTMRKPMHGSITDLPTAPTTSSTTTSTTTGGTGSSMVVGTTDEGGSRCNVGHSTKRQARWHMVAAVASRTSSNNSSSNSSDTVEDDAHQELHLTTTSVAMMAMSCSKSLAAAVVVVVLLHDHRRLQALNLKTGKQMTTKEISARLGVKIEC